MKGTSTVRWSYQQCLLLLPARAVLPCVLKRPLWTQVPASLNRRPLFLMYLLALLEFLKVFVDHMQPGWEEIEWNEWHLKKKLKKEKDKIKYVQAIAEVIPQMHCGLRGEPQVWIIECTECYISYESWLSSVVWNYKSVDKGRFIPDWVLCQAQLGKCCSLQRWTSIIIRGAAGRVPSVHSNCPFFMCQFYDALGKMWCECVLMFIGFVKFLYLWTLFWDKSSPPKKTFLLSVLSVESSLKIEDNQEEKAKQHRDCGHIRRQ